MEKLRKAKGRLAWIKMIARLRCLVKCSERLTGFLLSSVCYRDCVWQRNSECIRTSLLHPRAPSFGALHGFLGSAAMPARLPVTRIFKKCTEGEFQGVNLHLTLSHYLTSISPLSLVGKPLRCEMTSHDTSTCVITMSRDIVTSCGRTSRGKKAIWSVPV